MIMATPVTSGAASAADASFSDFAETDLIRVLRRRFWKAIQEEDVDTATRAYLANRNDYEQWVEEERMAAEKLANAAAAAKGKSKARSLKRVGSIAKRKSSKSILDPTKEKLTGVEAALPPSLTNEKCATKNTRPILQLAMKPSDPFVPDDFLDPFGSYDDPEKEEPKPTTRRKSVTKRIGKKLKPRLAGFGMFSRNRNNTDDILETPLDDSDDDGPALDLNMTTPLHEAARLGASDLVRLMLSQGGDPNVKNGRLQTALHAVSGGFTAEEEKLLLASVNGPPTTTDQPHVWSATMGVRVPIVEQKEVEDPNKAAKRKSVSKKAARAMSKMFRRAATSKTNVDVEEITEKPVYIPDPVRWNQLATDRMDATLTILSWNHPDDGSPAVGDGPSINAVDGDGRTALHYAAELGRSDICMAILSSFGAMLTIVDETGRTPCEYAADRAHNDLAAQLEARALLYIDPYGLDDELQVATILSVTDDSLHPSRRALVPPFQWFDTLLPERVLEQRSTRIGCVLDEMQEILEKRDCDKDLKKIMAPKAAAAAIATAVLSDDDEEGNGNNNNGEGSDDNTDAKAKKKSAKRDCGNGDDDDDALVVFANLQEYHVDKFLTYHNWDAKKALKEFRSNPFRAFEKATVDLPKKHKKILGHGKTEDPEESQTCLICFDDVNADRWKPIYGCSHGFCKDCLADYVSDCAATKSTGLALLCPHHECTNPLSKEQIRDFSPSPDVYARLEEAASERFVASASDFTFCPFPGCTGVVRRANQGVVSNVGVEPDFISYTGAVCTAVSEAAECDDRDDCPRTYDGSLDPHYFNPKSSEPCPKVHRFCFACGEGMHWPVTCERLEEWKDKVREETLDYGENGQTEQNSAYADVAQKLWLKANTRPCPQCNVPIEKNEGCNHMTCTNPSCKHEFCWICRRDWKLHGSATGGFFRCNIWQEDEQTHEFYDTPPTEEERQQGNATNMADPMFARGSDENYQGYGTAIHSARVAIKKKQDMARFLHHYTRWNAHAESAALERIMAESVATRLAPVVDAAIDFNGSPDFNFDGKGLSFIHAAFTELLECRSFLQHSYAFSYFRYSSMQRFRRFGQLGQRRREKMAFEQLQSELEMITEQMSDIVARSHLRATQFQITFLTASAAEKRTEFSQLMFSVLHEERKEARAAASGGGSSSDNTDKKRKKKKKKSDSNSQQPHLFARLDNYNNNNNMAMGRVLVADEPSDTSYSDNGDFDEALRASLDDFMSAANMEHTTTSRLQQFMLEPGGGGGGIGGPVQMWGCPACTYMNSGGTRCAMCNHYSPGDVM